MMVDAPVGVPICPYCGSLSFNKGVVDSWFLYKEPEKYRCCGCGRWLDKKLIYEGFANDAVDEQRKP